MNCCIQETITDAEFAHLRGIIALDISYCTQRTITDQAFEHLRGIKKLNMRNCDQCTITNSGIAHVVGICSLNFYACKRDVCVAAAQVLGKAEYASDDEVEYLSDDNEFWVSRMADMGGFATTTTTKNKD